MTELNELWKVFQESSPLLLLALFVVYAWIKRDKQDERQDVKETTLIKTFQELSNYIAINANKLELVGAGLNTLNVNIDGIQSTVLEFNKANQEHLTRIEQRLETLPDKVQEQLADAFNSMGERISEVFTKIDSLNNDVKELMIDWVTAREQFQSVLKKPISDEVSSSAEKVVKELDKNDG